MDSLLLVCKSPSHSIKYTPPYPLKERRLKERAAPYWLRIRFIMKAPLKERSPEGTPQNQLLYRKAINYTLKNKK